MRGQAILVVDDTPVNLKLTRVLLTGAGYEVRTAQNGEEALEVFRASNPAMVLVDIQLPGMDGLELTRRLRAERGGQETVVLALTASSMSGDEQRALEAGCDGFIAKPINTRALVDTVAKHLQQGKPKPVPKPDQDSRLAEFRSGIHELSERLFAEGREQTARLLDSLDTGINRPQAKHLMHQWVGVGSLLGHPEVTRLARELETLLDEDYTQTVPELRAKLLELSAFFDRNP
jgi:CheY-like chemotaxis protein